MNTSGISHKKDSISHYDYIDEDKLNDIYININKDVQKNREQKTFNEFMNDVPINIKKELIVQEASLNSQNKSFIYNKNISKYLAKKSKKSEEDLLMNKTDQYRIKKEFEELILNKSPTSFENNIPISDWMMNLRRTKDNNNNIPGTSYIYYGDVTNPFWVPVREKKNKSIDFIRNPFSKTKTDFKSYMKNKSVIDSQIFEGSNNMINSFNSFSFMNNNNNQDNKNVSCASSMNTNSNNFVPQDLFVRLCFKFF